MSATEPNAPERAFDLVVLVTSLGGLGAVSTVLTGLPGACNVPIAVLQHRSPTRGADQLPELLQRHTSLPVRGTSSGAAVDQPGISVLPGGRTAAIDARGCYRVYETPRAGGGDELLISAAEAFGARVLGVVLTGSLHDGAVGVRAVKTAGGRVLAEDPATARAAGMPSAAVATGCVDFVLPLERIAAAITALSMAPGAAELLTVPTPPWARLAVDRPPA